MDRLSFIIAEQDVGKRLDALLAEKQPGVSRRKTRELCKSGAVRVNGKRSQPGRVMVLGEKVESEIIPEVSARSELAPNGLSVVHGQIEIHFEDSHLLIVNKPRAMYSVTHRVEDQLTLADWVSGYCPETMSASPDRREAGLVARLDYYTNGLLIAAKTRPAWTALRELLFAQQIEKRYLALVEGRTAESGTITSPLRQSPDGKKMLVLPDSDPADGERIFAAETEYRRLKFYRCPKYKIDVSLLELTTKRAKRHQIRAHLESIGHALVGDENYGSRYSSYCPVGMSLEETDYHIETSEEPNTVEGFYLSANFLSFAHPLEPLQVVASL